METSPPAPLPQERRWGMKGEDSHTGLETLRMGVGGGCEYWKGEWVWGGASHTHPVALLTRQSWQPVKAPITLHRDTR